MDFASEAEYLDYHRPGNPEPDVQQELIPDHDTDSTVRPGKNSVIIYTCAFTPRVFTSINHQLNSIKQHFEPLHLSLVCNANMANK